jgi:hypothetical protein
MRLAVAFLVTTFAFAADPCTLITADQVGTAVGVKMDLGKPIGTKTCSFASTAGKTINVTVIEEDSFTRGKGGTLPGLKVTMASGIGDEAYYTDYGKLITLAVRKGKSAFLLRVYGIPTPQQESKEKAIALAVLPKL